MQGVQIQVQQQSWRCGEIVIDPLRRRLIRDGRALEIDQRAFDLIVLLAAERERCVDRREIISALWGARPISDNTLRQVVYKARRALGDDGDRQNIIRTVRGRSLRWVAPIATELPAAEAGDTAPAASAPDRNPPLRHWPPRRAYAAAALALVLLLAAMAWHAWQRPQSVRVAILPVDNATGEATLEWTREGIPGLLSTLLEADGVPVVDPHRAALAWRRVPGAQSARALGEALGAGEVVLGQLSRLDEGTGYELDFEVSAPSRAPVRIALSGDRPGALAAQAVPRLLRALGHPPREQAPHEATQPAHGSDGEKPRANHA